MATPGRDALAVRDYVAGRLSDVERDAFEERLLSEASLVQDLDESLRLREGLEVLREQEVLGTLSKPRRRGFNRAWSYASAAALAVVVVSVAVYFGNGSRPIVAVSLGALAGSNPPLAVVERYTFAEMRAEASSRDLGLPASGALELRALTPVTDASRKFRVTLSRVRTQKASQIGKAEHLVPDAEGFVAIYADASRLEPGDYWLSVESEDENEDKIASERFAFGLGRVGD